MRENDVRKMSKTIISDFVEEGFHALLLNYSLR